jgi:hypothetical protein
MYIYIRTHKGKVHPRTHYEDPQGEYRYSSTLSLTSAIQRGGWLMPPVAALAPEGGPVPMVQKAGWVPVPMVQKAGRSQYPCYRKLGGSQYPCYRRLGGPRVGLDGCGKYRPHRDSIPDRQPAASRYTDSYSTSHTHTHIISK